MATESIIEVTLVSQEVVAEVIYQEIVIDNIRTVVDSGSSQNFLDRLSDTNLGSGRIVYQTVTGVDYASSNNQSCYAKVIGFTKNSTVTGEFTKVQSHGEMNGFYALMPGLPIYLGLNGLITQVPVTSGIHQQLGVASSTDSIIISISQPITLE